MLVRGLENRNEMANQPQVIHATNPATYGQRPQRDTRLRLGTMTEPLEHLPLSTNDGLDVLWRYMDWWKYEDLMAKRALWMSTARTLDTGEGEHVLVGPENRAVQRSHRQWIEHVRDRLLISCWHESDRENEYMWLQYTKTMDSVVIKTTARRLSECFAYSRYAVLHRVQYVREPLSISSTPGSCDLHASVLYKSVESASDQEVRLICEPDLRIKVFERRSAADGSVEELESWNPDKHGDPRLLQVDPFMLVSEVRPHPESDHEEMRQKITRLHSRALQGLASQPYVAVGESEYSA